MHTTHAFTYAAETLLADAAGVLYWPKHETLIVSDLHLEKGSASAARGFPAPPYDTRETLLALAALIEKYEPERVICLGDSFHDDDAEGRMAPEDQLLLAGLIENREWVWVAGNHDPAPGDGFGGTVTGRYELGPLVFIHQAAHNDTHEVSGHFHPKAATLVKSTRLSGRCFVIDRGQLILPAFGTYTGGLDVLSPPMQEILTLDFSVALIGNERIVRFPRSRLI
jgi:DNA ligase-associated metallophosphoesterase